MNNNTTNNSAGTNWSKDEVSDCVDTYFECLRKDILGERFNKSEVYRTLSAKSGRTAKSIEFKFQNISAVLDEIGIEWINGLAPMVNYQKLLADVIETRANEIIELSEIATTNGFEDLASLYIEPAPERASVPTELPDYMTHLVRKFDPVQRDLDNRELGESGEELVFEFEKRTLSAMDRIDLSKKVRWVSKLDGDGAGYDILSFDPRGEKKFIEVKTTNGGNRTPFFISRNEHQFAKRNAGNFHLTRVFNFRRNPRVFNLNGPLEKFLRLSTETFRADFRA